VPRFLGAKVFNDVPLASLTPYIDWMPFFNAWEFTRQFPDVLDDPCAARRRVPCTRTRRKCSPPSCASTG
jgi:cobalamin-dependent methionine synthase I